MSEWWREVEATAACHHPLADRISIPSEHIQKCGWCGEVRFLRDAGKLWPSVTKASEQVRRPTELVQE